MRLPFIALRLISTHRILYGDFGCEFTEESFEDELVDDELSLLASEILSMDHGQAPPTSVSYYT